MELGLCQKVVIVTGGAGTIGRAAVEGFLAEGVSVAVADVDRGRGGTFVEEVARVADGRVLFCPLDLEDLGSIEAAVDAVLEAFGRIDSIVNNAAVFAFDPLDAWPSPDCLDRHYRVGIRGPTWLVREAWRRHPASRGGSVVNISSIAGHVGEPNAFAYTPIKAAIKGLTLSCAMEMADHGGWAVTISPGHTWSEVHKKRADAAGLDREAYEAAAPNIRTTLFGRFLDPAEVARWIVLAASPAGKALSGQDLHVSLGIESGGFNRACQTALGADGDRE